MYVGTVDMPRSALPLSAAGRRFAADLGGASNEAWTLEAGQAMEVVLDAIARSDGTRASVIEAMRAAKVKRGILGTFGFDENGDITPAQVPIIRITGSTPPGTGTPAAVPGRRRRSRRADPVAADALTGDYRRWAARNASMFNRSAAPGPLTSSTIPCSDPSTSSNLAERALECAGLLRALGERILAGAQVQDRHANRSDDRADVGEARDLALARDAHDGREARGAVGRGLEDDPAAERRPDHQGLARAAGGVGDRDGLAGRALLVVGVGVAPHDDAEARRASPLASGIHEHVSLSLSLLSTAAGPEPRVAASNGWSAGSSVERFQPGPASAQKRTALGLTGAGEDAVLDPSPEDDPPQPATNAPTARLSRRRARSYAECRVGRATTRGPAETRPTRRATATRTPAAACP